MLDRMSRSGTTVAVGETGTVCSCQHPEPEADPFGEAYAASLLSTATRPRRAATTAPFSEPFPVPEYPPREWFDGPPDWVEEWREEHGLGPSKDENGILRLTVTDEGRIGGWWYEAGACIMHDHAACPGPSPTNYAAFHQADAICADGSAVRVGSIGNTHGHASPWVDYVQAQRHYADPSAQMIVCRAGDDVRGGWIAGAVVPGTTYGDVALLRRSGLSGDWRPMPPSWWRDHGVPSNVVRASEGYDALGPTLVTRPALPLVRSYSRGSRAAAILGGCAGVDDHAWNATATEFKAKVEAAFRQANPGLRAEMEWDDVASTGDSIAGWGVVRAAGVGTQKFTASEDAASGAVSVKATGRVASVVAAWGDGETTVTTTVRRDKGVRMKRTRVEMPDGTVIESEEPDRRTPRARAAAAPKGNPEALREWFNAGADGQINWGESGAFDACVAIAGEHMDEEQAKGYCAERHNDAVGKYPGDKGGDGEAVTATVGTPDVDDLADAVSEVKEGDAGAGLQEQVNDLNERLLIVEKIINQQMEAQVASMLAEELPLPSLDH